MNIPKNAQYLHEGLYYKKGVHDIVFKWVADEWTRSTKKWSEVVRGDKVKAI